MEYNKNRLKNTQQLINGIVIEFNQQLTELRNISDTLDNEKMPPKTISNQIVIQMETTSMLVRILQSLSRL